MSNIEWRIDPPSELPMILNRLGRADTYAIRSTQYTTARYTVKAVNRAKAGARSLPTRAPEDRGRRRALAKGVGARRTKWGYRVTTSAPAPGMEWYPRYIMKSWVHPVFGNKSNMVIQKEMHDWFLGPIGNLWDDMYSDLREDTESLARFIAGR